MSKRTPPTPSPRHCHPRKPRLGQHILTDRSVLKTILRVAELSQEDRLVEIGAGTGVLTAAAAPLVKHITALEIDERLCTRLREKLKGVPNLTIVNADALTFHYEELGAPLKVIGNLPYYIATPILMRLVQLKGSISDMTLMLQEEVARRLTSSPGKKEYGALTIKLQYYARVEKCLTVHPRSFFPPPKVDSAIVKVTFPKSPRPAPRDERLFLKVVEAAFAHRRKTIKNSLTAALHPLLSEELIEKALRSAGINPGLRGEALSIEDYIMLSDSLA